MDEDGELRSEIYLHEEGISEMFGSRGEPCWKFPTLSQWESVSSGGEDKSVLIRYIG